MADLIDQSLATGGIEDDNAPEVEVTEKIYRVFESTKIPVSKDLGKYHKTKVMASVDKRKREGLTEAWDEAIAYYQNNQQPHRDGGNPDRSGNRTAARRKSEQFSETENVVFSNINNIVPAIYAKNPVAEFTTDSEQHKKLATTLERLVNNLSRKRTAPGLNLKPKAKKCVVNALLTNNAWFEVGYTKRSDSSETAFKQLEELSTAYANAKDTKEIKEIEGKLQALEEKVNFLKPSGPFVKVRQSDQVIMDNNAEDSSGTDGTFMAVWDYIQTGLLNALYTKDGKYIYEPSHVTKPSTEETKGVDNDVNSFTLFEGESTFKKYGYADEFSYKQAQYTKVWYFWDAITHRVILYADSDWSWPIWVWDDPYHLEGFFPFTKLSLYTDPVKVESPGEVSYYLDQQDAINEMADEERRLRNTVKNKFIYNTNVMSKSEAEKYLKSGDDTAVGINVDAEIDLSKAMTSPVSPALKYLDVLFNPTKKFQAIERISSVNAIMRNAEFKTNTTNRAIEVYESGTITRLDEKIDAVEDALGNVYWQIAQMCLQFMTAEEVSILIGQSVLDMWKQMQPEEVRQLFNFQVVGGSTVKPTSRAKKKEAVEVGQILGQFASAAPQTVIVMLKLFEQAFDEINIKEEDWTELKDGIQQQLTRGVSSQGGQQPAQQGNDAAIENAIQQATQQGIPPDVARQMIESKLKGNAQ